MAVSTGFRQPCPSCEAMVPIKDSSLVGKKIDCPKCKYRFIVEAPAEEEADVEEEKPAKKAAAKASSRGKPLPNRDDDDDDKPRAKKGGNNMLLVGGGLGAAAALLLAVFYFTGMFGGDTKPTPATPPVAQNNNPPRGGPVEPGKTEAVKSGDTVKAEGVKTEGVRGEGAIGAESAVPANAGGGADNAAAVVGREITNLLPNDTQVVFSLNMHNFEVSPMGRNLFDPSTRTIEFVEANLGVKPRDINRVVCAGHAIAGWGFCVMQAKTPFDVKKVQAALCKDSTPMKDKSGKFAYFILKSNPLLECLGAYAEGMLGDLKLPLFQASPGRKFAARILGDSQTIVVADESAMLKFLADNEKPRQQSVLATDPDGGGAPPAETPAGRGSPRGPTPAVAGGGEGAPGGTAAGPQNTTNGSYLTIRPHIKQMMNRMEDNEKDIVMSTAFQVDLGGVGDSILNKMTYGLVGGPGQGHEFAPVLGGVITKVDGKRGAARAYVEQDIKDEVSRKRADDFKTLMRPRIVAFLESTFGVKIDASGAGGGGGAGGPTPASPGGPRTPGPTPSRPGRQGFDDEPSGINQSLMQRGRPGESGVAGGGQPGSGTPSPTTGPSTVDISSNGRVISITIDLDWASSYNQTVSGYFEGLVEQERSRAVLLAARAHWTSLSKGLAAFKAQGTFPKGAYPRRTNPERYNLPFAPEQRVSWMAQLLPSLGYENIYRSIDFELSWSHESNLRPASRWIPEFLSPSQPEASWRAELPSVGAKELGATHFIGLSGIGLDAADFPDTPEFAKKLGIFGYNRQTKFEDVVKGDGTSNTIFMIQVSPLVPRPWIRGGGATVQGVPEKDSFLPFSVSQGDLRYGSYAVMADGSVRFINSNITPEVFKALVTYKGGEKIDNLDAVAPIEEAQKLDRQNGKRNLKSGESILTGTWETQNLDDLYLKVQTPGKLEKKLGGALDFAAPSTENPLYRIHVTPFTEKPAPQEDGDNQADLDRVLAFLESKGSRPEKLQKMTVGRKNCRRFEVSTSSGQFYNQLFIIAGKPVLMEVKKNTVPEADMLKFFNSVIIDEPKVVRGWQKLEVALGGVTAEAEVPGRARRLTSPSDAFNNKWAVRVGDAKAPASFEIDVRTGPDYGQNDFGGKSADKYKEGLRNEGMQVYEVKGVHVGDFDGLTFKVDYKTKEKDPMNNNQEKIVEHKDIQRVFILGGKIVIFRVADYDRAREGDIKRFLDSAKVSK